MAGSLVQVVVMAETSMVVQVAQELNRLSAVLLLITVVVVAQPVAVLAVLVEAETQAVMLGLPTLVAVAVEMITATSKAAISLVAAAVGQALCLFATQGPLSTQAARSQQLAATRFTSS
jgi:hypothetical protein